MKNGIAFFLLLNLVQVCTTVQLTFAEQKNLKSCTIKETASGTEYYDQRGKLVGAKHTYDSGEWYFIPQTQAAKELQIGVIKGKIKALTKGFESNAHPNVTISLLNNIDLSELSSRCEFVKFSGFKEAEAEAKPWDPVRFLWGFRAVDEGNKDVNFNNELFLKHTTIPTDSDTKYLGKNDREYVFQEGNHTAPVNFIAELKKFLLSPVGYKNCIEPKITALCKSKTGQTPIVNPPSQTDGNAKENTETGGKAGGDNKTKPGAKKIK